MKLEYGKIVKILGNEHYKTLLNFCVGVGVGGHTLDHRVVHAKIDFTGVKIAQVDPKSNKLEDLIRSTCGKCNSIHYVKIGPKTPTQISTTAQPSKNKAPVSVDPCSSFSLNS